MKKCPFCGEDIQDVAIKCRHCNSDLLNKISGPQANIPTPKSPAPPAMQVQKKSGIAKGCLYAFFIGVGVIVILVIIGLFLGPDKKSDTPAPFQEDPKSQALKAERERLLKAANNPQPSPQNRVETPPAPQPANNWIYNESDDQMSGGKVKTAGIQSNNTLSFKFPYAGDQKAMLMLRLHPRLGDAVVISIPRGQFICSITEGCDVQVRFDNGSYQTFHAMPPADYSTTAIFLKDYSQFVSYLKHARTVKIEAQFYQEGNQTLEFNVDGLDW